jgi:hypothetical protein
MNFDWVTERANCSLGVVFDRLLEDTRADAATRNKQMGPVRLEVDAKPQVFTVFATDVKTSRVTRVEFQLGANTIEVVALDGGTLRLSAGLSLGDDGVCRLVVGGAGLLPWQFRRRALEGLFFG